MRFIPYRIMGDNNVYKDNNKQLIAIYADIFIYGSKASEALAKNISKDVSDAWNRPNARIKISDKEYAVIFKIRGFYTTSPLNWMHGNKDHKKVFMRIEDHTDMPSQGEISYMDNIGSNSGVFLIQNVIGKHSTTEAHEMGHGWGRIHDASGHGQPSIMWPRGSQVDSQYRYVPSSQSSTLNPEKRIVSTIDIQKLALDRLRYDQKGRAILGKLTNQYHSFI